MEYLRSTQRLTILDECMGVEIETAFLSRDGYPSIDQNPQWGGDTELIDTFFEHGQWWLSVTTEYTDEEMSDNHTVTYSVVDCNTYCGFDFELISDEEY